MSKIKLPHASGNSVSIAAPQSNPASDRTLYLPSNADGTIVTSTSPDADRFKAGEVVQVQFTEFQPMTDSFGGPLSNGTYTSMGSIGLTWSFTPKFSDSILSVETNLECKLNDENGYARWQIYDNTNTAIFHNGTYCGGSHYYAKTDYWLPVNIRAKGGALNTNARTYALRVQISDGGTISFNWSSDDRRLITMTEIKQ